MGLHIKELEFQDYEKVIEIRDPQRHLHAFIAIHSTLMGPALGGTRILPYSSREEALTDVLRLAKGMTYKAALCHSGTGGSKSTIILPKEGKSQAFFDAYAEGVNYLGGKHLCAEDMNCTESDLVMIHKVTPYCLGLPGDGTGDPSPYTAWGVFRGLQAVSKKLWGTDELEGRTVAIQGIGGVGGKLLHHLFWAGAKLIVSDLDQELLKKAAHQYCAQIIPKEEFIQAKCDILAPCARGGLLNSTTIPKLRCQAIAGAANNQLETEEDGDRLFKKGILYAPDYLVNAGGLMSVASGLDPQLYPPTSVRNRTSNIYQRSLEIFDLAEKKGISTDAAANEIVDQLMMEERKSKNALV